MPPKHLIRQQLKFENRVFQGNLPFSDKKVEDELRSGKVVKKEWTNMALQMIFISRKLLGHKFPEVWILYSTEIYVMQILNPTTWKVIKKIPLTAKPNSAALVPTVGKIWVGLTNGTYDVYDINNKSKETKTGFRQAIIKLVYSEVLNNIVSITVDGCVRFFDVETGNMVVTFNTRIDHVSDFTVVQKSGDNMIYVAVIYKQHSINLYTVNNTSYEVNHIGSYVHTSDDGEEIEISRIITIPEALMNDMIEEAKKLKQASNVKATPELPRNSNVDVKDLSSEIKQIPSYVNKDEAIKKSPSSMRMAKLNSIAVPRPDHNKRAGYPAILCGTIDGNIIVFGLNPFQEIVKFGAFTFGSLKESKDFVETKKTDKAFVDAVTGKDGYSRRTQMMKSKTPGTGHVSTMQLSQLGGMYFDNNHTIWTWAYSYHQARAFDVPISLYNETGSSYSPFVKFGLSRLIEEQVPMTVLGLVEEPVPMLVTADSTGRFSIWGDDSALGLGGEEPKEEEEPDGPKDFGAEPYFLDDNKFIVTGDDTYDELVEKIKKELSIYINITMNAVDSYGKYKTEIDDIAPRIIRVNDKMMDHSEKTVKTLKKHLNLMIRIRELIIELGATKSFEGTQMSSLSALSDKVVSCSKKLITQVQSVASETIKTGGKVVDFLESHSSNITSTADYTRLNLSGFGDITSNVVMQLGDLYRIILANIEYKDIVDLHALEKLKAKYQALLSERDDLLAKYEALKKLLDEKETEIVNMNEVLRDTKKLFNDTVKRAEFLETELRERTEELDKANSEKNALVKVNTGLQNTINTLKKKVADLEEKLREQREIEDTLNLKIEEYEGMINALNNEIAGLQNEILALKKELKELKEKFEEREKDLLEQLEYYKGTLKKITRSLNKFMEEEVCNLNVPQPGKTLLRKKSSKALLRVSSNGNLVVSSGELTPIKVSAGDSTQNLADESGKKTPASPKSATGRGTISPNEITVDTNGNVIYKESGEIVPASILKNKSFSSLEEPLGDSAGGSSRNSPLSRSRSRESVVIDTKSDKRNTGKGGESPSLTRKDSKSLSKSPSKPSYDYKSSVLLTSKSFDQSLEVIADKLHALSEALDSANTLIDNYRNELDERAARYSDLNGNSKNVMDLLNEKINSLTDENSRLQKLYDDLKKSYDNRTDGQDTAKSSSTMMKDKEIQTKIKTEKVTRVYNTNDMSDELDRLKKKMRLIKAERDGLREDNGKLKESVNVAEHKLQKRREKLTDAINDLERTRAKLKREQEEHDAELERMGSDMRSLKASEERSRCEIAKLQSEVGRRIIDAESANSRILELTSTNTDLTKLNGDYSNQLENYRLELAKLSGKVSELSFENEKSRMAVAENERTMAAIEDFNNYKEYIFHKSQDGFSGESSVPLNASGSEVGSERNLSKKPSARDLGNTSSPHRSSKSQLPKVGSSTKLETHAKITKSSSRSTITGFKVEVDVSKGAAANSNRESAGPTKSPITPKVSKSPSSATL